MVTTKFYLDARATKKGAPAPLKLAINSKGSSAYIPLNVSLIPEVQWDKKTGKIKNHPKKAQLSTFIAQRKVEIDAIILSLIESGQCKGKTATAIKNMVMEVIDPDPNKDKEHTVAAMLVAHAKKLGGGSEDIYMGTYRRLKDFDPIHAESLRFEDIDKQWLERFDEFLAKTAPSVNARNIHLRNIRTIFNKAIDDEVTTAYPFRKFKIRPVPTRKRSMTVEALRKVIYGEVEDWQEKYRDVFVLTFCLIGINIVDLCRLTEIEEDGRVHYIRAKTHKPYSIKVEPEALERINRLRGKGQLLYMLDQHKSYRTYYNCLCNGLRAMKDKLNEGAETPIKELTTYWARHSWATIAASLDIPKETIAAALGHGGNSVTDIYIDFDKRKVDEANRKVLDYVFGVGKISDDGTPES